MVALALGLCAGFATTADGGELKVSLAAAVSGTGLTLAATSPGTQATSSLLVTVDGLDAAVAAQADPSLLSGPIDQQQAAVTVPTPSATGKAITVKFGEPLAMQPAANQRSWVLPITVDNLPAGVESTRYLSVTVGGVQKVLAYKLSSPAAPSSTWSLKALSATERAISPDGGVPLGISIVGTRPITGLRLGPVELIEQGEKRALASGQLALCANNSPCAAEPIERGGNHLHTLWMAPLADLKVAPGSHAASASPSPLHPGKYTGVVTVASDDKPGGESLTLTVFVSSACWRLLGVAVIFCGIVLAWWVTVYLRHRLNRDQLLLPAVVMRDAVDKLRVRHTALALPSSLVGVAARGVARRLDGIDNDLSDKPLERNGLPPLWPSPWPAALSSATLDGYRKYLDDIGKWVAGVQMIIDSGLQPLQARRAALASLSAEHVVELDKALLALDTQATGPMPPLADVLVQQITSTLAAFETAIAALPLPHDATGAAIGPLAAAVRPTPDELRLRIAAEGLAAWGYVAVVTLLAGSYMLVFKNPGFGTSLDLMEALLWGLGLPAAAQLTAATTTASTIATTFSVAR